MAGHISWSITAARIITLPPPCLTVGICMLQVLIFSQQNISPKVFKTLFGKCERALSVLLVSCSFMALELLLRSNFPSFPF